MIAQGSSGFDAAYFNSLTQEINSIDGCAALQALVNEAMASLQAQISAIEHEIAKLLPIITIPTDLPSVITWITNFIAPELAAYNAYLTQLTSMLAAITNLVTAIENAAARLEGCSITVPPITS
jgi:prefoldin subunit 5